MEKTILALCLALCGGDPRKAASVLSQAHKACEWTPPPIPSPTLEPLSDGAGWREGFFNSWDREDKKYSGRQWRARFGRQGKRQVGDVRMAKALRTARREKYGF